MTDLLVRTYQVRFGDAILIVVPETVDGREVKRRILIDVGNAFKTEGGADEVFGPVVDDIAAMLDGEPLDLYVMTHEHMDHVQGLLYASQKLGKSLTARQTWLTGSSDPGYYASHAEARKQKIAALAAFRAVRSALAAVPARSALADAVLANNDPMSTSDCVDYLRTLAPHATHYVNREMPLGGLQPSTAASISLWAPEENVADYYGRFKKLAADLRIADDARLEDAAAPSDEPPDDSDLPRPLVGVDAGAFYNLLDMRHSSQASTLLQIDQAANNTSVVLCLEWHGWRLLFPGDAEQRSWKTMDKLGLVKPVHFLKVSHHGSKTGLPPNDILAKLLPLPAPDGRPRRAVVSTFHDTYPGVPDPPTLKRIAERTDLTSTMDLPPGQLYVDFTFPSR
jgi:hypothetical protein